MMVEWKEEKPNFWRQMFANGSFPPENIRSMRHVKCFECFGGIEVNLLIEGFFFFFLSIAVFSNRRIRLFGQWPKEGAG